MQNHTECQGTAVECRDAVEVKISANPQLDVGCSMLDVGCFPAASELNISPTPFDELQATQARSAFIQFTKIFFGLDADCA